jgi:uroporphyrin-III C-methyltransferase/precorrin-2 dehydrogenase/sirohydrochlorin ferrochelatase
MHLPDYVEPFVDSESGRWGVTGAVGATIALALLSESDARVAGYLAAVAIGAAVAWSAFAAAQRRRDRLGRESDAVPRLPVFLRFDDRRVVVVGGGTVAAAKIPALLAAGARVSVIAPSVSQAIDRVRVHVIERPFEPADLDGAWFVTAAATPAVNRQVREAAESRGLFVNAVDDPANATAYLGGTVARGGVTVAFSTSGQAPALAGLLREAFDELLPEDLGTWAQRARELSTKQRREGVPMSDRRPLLLRVLNDLYDDRRRDGAGPR